MNKEILINEIINGLFTNGHGEKIGRLKLECEDGTYGGGYCKQAVRSIIEKAIAKATEVKP